MVEVAPRQPPPTALEQPPQREGHGHGVVTPQEAELARSTVDAQNLPYLRQRDATCRTAVDGQDLVPRADSRLSGGTAIDHIPDGKITVLGAPRGKDEPTPIVLAVPPDSADWLHDGAMPVVIEDQPAPVKQGAPGDAIDMLAAEKRLPLTAQAWRDGVQHDGSEPESGDIPNGDTERSGDTCDERAFDGRRDPGEMMLLDERRHENEAQASVARVEQKVRLGPIGFTSLEEDIHDGILVARGEREYDTCSMIEVPRAIV